MTSALSPLWEGFTLFCGLREGRAYRRGFTRRPGLDWSTFRSSHSLLGARTRALARSRRAHALAERGPSVASAQPQRSLRCHFAHLVSVGQRRRSCVQVPKNASLTVNTSPNESNTESGGVGIFTKTRKSCQKL